jgi:hypothetical protein
MIVMIGRFGNGVDHDSVMSIVMGSNQHAVRGEGRAAAGTQVREAGPSRQQEALGHCSAGQWNPGVAGLLARGVRSCGYQQRQQRETDLGVGHGHG